MLHSFSCDEGWIGLLLSILFSLGGTWAVVMVERNLAAGDRVNLRLLYSRDRPYFLPHLEFATDFLGVTSTPATATPSDQKSAHPKSSFQQLLRKLLDCPCWFHVQQSAKLAAVDQAGHTTVRPDIPPSGLTQLVQPDLGISVP